MRNQEPLAHLEKACNKEQSMEDHLQGVAELAKKFAEEFGNGDWAEQAGLWHDLGKYNPKWQEYLRNQTDSYYNQPESEEEE
ncbi:MAG: CRISPR-associated endonuclease Cas3'' [Limisphaerales bacterium]|jgi:CRISPR-associated endonuclease/helicase Cas3